MLALDRINIYDNVAIKNHDQHDSAFFYLQSKVDMPPELRDEVLTLVNHPNYQPLKPAVIAKKLGLDAEAVRNLKKTIKLLVKANKLAYGPSHLVYPSDKSPSRRKAAVKSEEKAAGKAAFQEAVKKKGAGSKGQGVVEENSKSKESERRRKGKLLRSLRATAAARIISPARSAARRVASGLCGRKERSGPKAAMPTSSFRPTNGRCRQRRHRLRAARIEARPDGQAGRPHHRCRRAGHQSVRRRVFRAGRHGDGADRRQDLRQPDLRRRSRRKACRPDDKVVIEMVRFPSHVRDGEGVIVEVLGPRGQPGVDTMSIIYEFNLPGEFADDVLAEARKQAEKFDESIGRGRRDLTELHDRHDRPGRRPRL